MAVVGIFGGRFDPPHLGHLALARAAVRHFGIDELHVTVVADAAHKPSEAPAEDRLELAKLTFADLNAVVELEEHAYTVDALEAYGYDEPIFLIGADQLAALPSWKEPERVLELATARRRRTPGQRAPDRVAASRGLRARAASRFLVGAPPACPGGKLDRRIRRTRRRRLHHRARPLHPRVTATLSALSSLEQARRIAALAAEKLAEDVVILDMRPVCVYTDFFVLATGRNARQTKAIYDEVYGRLKAEAKLTPRATDGTREAEWIVADYLDVVLHVFTPETRAFYRLEDLWGDVPAVELEAATA